MRQTLGFGRDLGIELGQRSVPVLDDVVFVIKLGKTLGQGQLMTKPLVDTQSKLSRRQPARQQLVRERPRGGFPPGLAVARVEHKAQLIEYDGKQVGHVVLRLGACASGQNAKCGAVESGNECCAGDLNDILRAGLADTPKNGEILQVIGCCFDRRHPHMIPGTRRSRRAHFAPGTGRADGRSTAQTAAHDQHKHPGAQSHQPLLTWDFQVGRGSVHERCLLDLVLARPGHCRSGAGLARCAVDRASDSVGRVLPEAVPGRRLGGHGVLVAGERVE